MLTDPGWEEDHGPSHPTLWKIYRQRLADPNLKAEFRDKMDVISCFRGRTAILNNPKKLTMEWPLEWTFLSMNVSSNSIM